MESKYLNFLLDENEINRIEDYKISISTQNQKLTQLQSLLLSRLAVGEEEKRM